MNKKLLMCRKPLGIAIFTLLLLTTAMIARQVETRGPVNPSHLDAADRDAVKALIAHDIGNVRFTQANWGEAGNPDGAVGFKGFEFPINSGNDFLFSAGIWVGAEVNGVRLVSTATDGDNGTNEFYPVHIGAVPQSNANASFNDWWVTSKNFSSFGSRNYIFGSKDIDDDGDWTTADDIDGDGKASKNYDGGKGLIGFDDDGDGQIDEEIANGVDDDSDGKIDEDTDNSGDANHDGNCGYDPEAHVDEDPAGDISHDYIDNDNDGLVDEADPNADGDQNIGFLDDDNDGLSDEDGIARGVQEYFTVFQDNIEAQFVGSPDVDGHTPLNIQVLQRSYAFPEDYAADFILIDYRIRNVGPLPLKKTFIGMFSDPDIGATGEGGDAASLDDQNFYDSTRTMAIQYDDPTDADGPGPGIFAIRVVKTPVALNQLKVTFRNFDRVSGGDPGTNGDKYNMVSSGTISPHTTQNGDWRMLIAFGDRENNGFEIPPGGELPITVAYIAGTDTLDGAKNAGWALAMFLNDFQGPSAPDVPDFSLDVYQDRVGIRWMPNSEVSVDAITGESDFEGYIVERSTDQLNWQTIVQYDKIDTLGYPFEWENFNAGMPEKIYTPDSSSYSYYYTDQNLIPGHTYYYSVRAYDTGVQGAGILYSGRTGNVETAIMARNSATGAPTNLDNVYVFPNPYKGGHAGESGGQVNPSKGLIEYPRKLVFMGLPPTTTTGDCKIRIFTLGGDYVAGIDHINGLEYDQWNLNSQNKQEIVSGIYYYTVEYKKPGGGTDFKIDKFVVIK